MLFQLIQLIIVFSFVELARLTLQAPSASGEGLIRATLWSLSPKQPPLFSLEINSPLSAKIGLIQVPLCCMELFLLRILICESAAPLNTSKCGMLAGHWILSTFMLSSPCGASSIQGAGHSAPSTPGFAACCSLVCAPCTARGSAGRRQRRERCAAQLGLSLGWMRPTVRPRSAGTGLTLPCTRTPSLRPPTPLLPGPLLDPHCPRFTLGFFALPFYKSTPVLPSLQRSPCCSSLPWPPLLQPALPCVMGTAWTPPPPRGLGHSTRSRGELLPFPSQNTGVQGTRRVGWHRGHTCVPL